MASSADIVPADLWREVRARFDAARKLYLKDTHGKVWGRPGTGVESKYLLTGLGECGCCGHNITMIGGRSGSAGMRQPAYYYDGCAYHHARGRTICTNDHHARMAEADALVIERVRGVLTPEVADEVIDETLETLAQRKRSRADAPDRLDAEARRLRKELNRFLAAIAGSTAPASVLAEIARREARLSAADMNLPGWKCHPLKGELAGHWAVWVDENWRMTFTFEGKDAILVDYRDYH